MRIHIGPNACVDNTVPLGDVLPGQPFMFSDDGCVDMSCVYVRVEAGHVNLYNGFYWPLHDSVSCRRVRVVNASVVVASLGSGK